jgi:acyl-CoA dehydrogenase family protein 9
MRKALREAKKCAKAVRVLLLSGALLYGRSIAKGQTANREFLLRRITSLSLYSFGLLALLSDADRRQRSGVLEKEELHILEYFAAEAREVRRNNYRLFDSKKERLSSAVFKEGATTTQAEDRPTEPVITQDDTTGRPVTKGAK